MNASKRVGFAVVGALLAGGLLLAACAVPEDHRAGDVVFHHPGVVVSHGGLRQAKQMVAAGKEPWLSAYRSS